MKSLPIALVLALAGLAAYYTIGIDRSAGEHAEAPRVETLVLNQTDFYSQTVRQVTTASGASRFRTAADKSLTDWLENSSEIASKHGTIATQDLLEQLSVDTPQISSATACIAFSGTMHQLSESVAGWLDSLDPSFNNFATYVFPDASSQQIGCAALAVERLPQFSPESVNAGAKTFFSICRLCHKSHIGTIEQTHGAAALTCPHCNRAYELLAFKFDGNVCRVNELLTGWEPPVDVPDGLSKVQEMVAIWNTVLKRVRYAKDFEGINGNLDTWQLAKETWKYKNGDCEDSSILLADWLIARGFDARVVVGTTDKLDGHAWCVVYLDGSCYILETTEAEPDLRNLPYASSLRTHYLPRYQFNRESVFYLQQQKTNPRYWSGAGWLQIDAQ